MLFAFESRKALVESLMSDSIRPPAVAQLGLSNEEWEKMANDGAEDGSSRRKITELLGEWYVYRFSCTDTI
jgi:hypothetical protein